MKPTTTKVLYWTLTIIFSLAMFLDGIGGVTQQEAGQEVMRHLGYPMYVLIIFGVAKLMGVIAIIQTKFLAIKEWAYAGFAFNFLGAFASRAFSGDSIGETIFPLIMLLIMFLPYLLWKKYQLVKQ
ncbi:MAG: DoxX family protein [Niastella sp.]|nr:DoxX family protein [Niastella sp.]